MTFIKNTMFLNNTRIKIQSGVVSLTHLVSKKVINNVISFKSGFWFCKKVPMFFSTKVALSRRLFCSIEL